MDQANTVDAHALNVSKILYRFAWFVEIIAVATGLAITVMVAMTTFESNAQLANSGATSNIVNVVIAALPFFLASVIELAKIPAAQAMYITVNLKWKIVFGITLLFLAAVTFETAINGFERNFTNISFKVTQLKDQREKVVSTRDELNRQIDEDSKVTLEMVMDKNRQRKQELDQKRTDDTNSLKESYAKLDERQANLNDDIERLRQQLSDLQADRREKEREQKDAQDKNRSAADAEAKQERDRLEQFWIEQKNELEKVKAEAKEANEKASFWSKGRIKMEGDQNIADQQARVDDAYAKLESFSLAEASQDALGKYSDISERIKSEFDAREQEIKLQINELVSRRDQTQDSEEAIQRAKERAELEERYRDDMSRLQADAEKDIEAFENIAARRAENQDKLRDVEEQLIGLNEEINLAAQDNQVYRLAKLFSDGESIAEVSNEKVNLVAKIWFGSLASIIAFTGILLALASEVVKRQSRSTPSSPRGVASALASLSLSINRLVRAKPRVEYRTKEVIKEVPVEKVVVQDVVKEVIKKEVVHVPVYTSNKDILKRQDENNG